jgi:hypothetical protein
MCLNQSAISLDNRIRTFIKLDQLVQEENWNYYEDHEVIASILGTGPGPVTLLVESLLN